MNYYLLPWEPLPYKVPHRLTSYLSEIGRLRHPVWQFQLPPICFHSLEESIWDVIFLLLWNATTFAKGSYSHYLNVLVSHTDTSPLQQTNILGLAGLNLCVFKQMQVKSLFGGSSTSLLSPPCGNRHSTNFASHWETCRDVFVLDYIIGLYVLCFSLCFSLLFFLMFYKNLYFENRFCFMYC